MKELLRQIVAELENVHVVASSDRLFELVTEARALIESDDWQSLDTPSDVEDLKCGEAVLPED